MKEAHGEAVAGFWLTCLSFAQLAALADFGVAPVLARHTAFSRGRTQGGADYTGSRVLNIETELGSWIAAAKVLAIVSSFIAIVALGILWFMAIEPIGGALLSAARARETWMLTSVTIVSRLLMKPDIAVLEGFGRAYWIRLIFGSSQVLAATTAVVMVKHVGVSLVFIAVVYLAFALVELLLYKLLCSKCVRCAPVPASIGIDRALAWKMVRLAVPFGVVNLGGVLFSSIQVPFIARLLGPDEVLVYFVIQRLAQSMNLGVMQAALAGLPRFTFLLGKGDCRGARRLMDGSIAGASALILVAACIGLFIFPVICSKIFHIDEVPGGLLMLVMVDSILLVTCTVWGQFVLASGRNPLWKAVLVSGMFNTLLLGPLLLEFGASAAPLASIVAGVVSVYWWSVVCGVRLRNELNASERSLIAAQK
jgi:O-antigen/teichoic acid export membrane protein